MPLLRALISRWGWLHLFDWLRSLRARGTANLGERPAGMRYGVERVSEPEREPLSACPRDHGAVIGAQRRRRRHQSGAGFECDLMEDLADSLVCGNSAGSYQRRRPAIATGERLEATAHPIGDDFDNALLKRGAEVADVLVGQGRDLFRFEAEGRFQSRE